MECGRERLEEKGRRGNCPEIRHRNNQTKKTTNIHRMGPRAPKAADYIVCIHNVCLLTQLCMPLITYYYNFSTQIASVSYENLAFLLIEKDAPKSM